jgi:O-antigen ligase
MAKSGALLNALRIVLGLGMMLIGFLLTLSMVVEDAAATQTLDGNGARLMAYAAAPMLIPFCAFALRRTWRARSWVFLIVATMCFVVQASIAGSRGPIP